jgi:hypothetical protein
VSTTGSDVAPGTQAKPFRTLGKAIASAGPGDLIRVAAGTYYETPEVAAEARDGTAAKRIILRGEGKPKLLLESPLLVQRAYWTIDGFNIDLRNRPHFAVMFSGNTQGSALVNSEVHHGAFGAGITFYGGARGVTIEGNNIHHFWRTNVDSHGIVIQPNARDITIRNNNIHDNSGDSIQCLGPEGYSNNPPATGVLIEGNDLHTSVEQAIDIKTCYNIVVRKNRMHHFRYDRVRGGNAAMVIHMSPRNVLIEDNEFYDAGLAIGLGGNHVGPVPTGVTIRRNRIRDMITQGGLMTGGGIQIENSQGAVVMHNTFTRLEGPALTFGDGAGGATTNLTIKNNIIEGQMLVKIGAHTPGLVMNSNLYEPGGAFSEKGIVMSFEQWQATNRDLRSRQLPADLNPDTLAPGANARDQGEEVGLPFCGTAPDVGYVEVGCAGG